MSTAYENLKRELESKEHCWLVTGVAGFIGSHLLETLLNLNQRVVGLDNFSTGNWENLADVESKASKRRWSRFHFIEGDLLDFDSCREAVQNADFVLHQAALGSVPRSLKEPLATNASNITGFLNVLVAAKEARVKRFVYASSSSIYGDHPALPKKEETIGKPLSPYAVTKYVNEVYADTFSRCYQIDTIGLRYFNVFGARQDPQSAYAAVIPKWYAGLLRNEAVYINGDGKTSRDFCFIDNAVQMNLLAAGSRNQNAFNQAYNVAYSQQMTLEDLFGLIRRQVSTVKPEALGQKPIYRDFRPGDVRHSLADIGKAKTLLGYQPTHSLEEGLQETTGWYLQKLFSSGPRKEAVI